MVTGQGTTLQIGQETTWGTKATATVALNFTSEGFKLNVDKTEEDSLIGSATTRSLDIQKKSVDFDFSVLAKPENIGLLLGMTLGTEGAATAVSGKTGVYTHAFTPIEPGVSVSLPKFTADVDRHVAVKAYTGCKIGSMKLSCKAGDYMRIDFSGKGKDEEAGTVQSSLSVTTLKAFRFAGGKVTFDDTEYGDVTDVEFNYDNALDGGEQTTGSGYYGTEPEPQKRAITVSVGAFYDSNSETLRENKYKTESTAKVELEFISPSLAYDADADAEDDTGDTHYSIKVSMPLVVINDCSPNVTGTEKIKLTIGGTAIESAANKAVTITLTDKTKKKYLA